MPTEAELVAAIEALCVCVLLAEAELEASGR
jgi:hypothetical protein